MLKQLFGSAVLALALNGSAQAVPITFYDNLANTMGGGFFVGPRPSATPGFAIPFLATASADLTSVTLTLTGADPSSALVRLLSDASALPGSPVSGFFALTGIVGNDYTFAAPVATAVTSGVRYWLEISVPVTDTFTLGTSFASGNSGTGYQGNLYGAYASGVWTTSSNGQDVRAQINGATLDAPEIDPGRASAPLFMAMLCLGLVGGRRTGYRAACP